MKTPITQKNENLPTIEMLIINLTSSKHSENVIEIMFHCLNNDWFVVLFPLVDVDFNKMKDYYIGKDFYETKINYKGRIFEEEGRPTE